MITVTCEIVPAYFFPQLNLSVTEPCLPTQCYNWLLKLPDKITLWTHHMPGPAAPINASIWLASDNPNRLPVYCYITVWTHHVPGPTTHIYAIIWLASNNQILVHLHNKTVLPTEEIRLTLKGHFVADSVAWLVEWKWNQKYQSSNIILNLIFKNIPPKYDKAKFKTHKNGGNFVLENKLPLVNQTYQSSNIILNLILKNIPQKYDKAIICLYVLC